MGNEGSTQFEHVNDAQSREVFGPTQFHQLQRTRDIAEPLPKLILTSPDQSHSFMRLETSSKNSSASSAEDYSIVSHNKHERHVRERLQEPVQEATGTTEPAADDTILDAEKALSNLSPEEKAQIEQVLARVRQLETKEDRRLKQLKTQLKKTEQEVRRRLSLSNQDISERLLICPLCQRCCDGDQDSNFSSGLSSSYEGTQLLCVCSQCGTRCCNDCGSFIREE
ncbi:hypothetical protein Ciccas_011698, partial [Cichlidogyrus casuarinus]